MHISVLPVLRPGAPPFGCFDQAILELLTGIPMLAPLTELPMKTLLRAVTPLHQDEVKPLFRQGEASDVLYVVAGGEVILTASAFPGGRSTIIGIVRAGECFGEEAVLGQKRLVTADAGAGSSLIAIDPTILPLDSHSVLEHVFQRFSAMVSEISALKSVPPAQRMARLLMSLVQNSTGPAVIPLPTFRKFMAGWIGVRPETFSRQILPKLKAVGVTFGDDLIDIADVEVLARFAQSHAIMKCFR